MTETARARRILILDEDPAMLEILTTCLRSPEVELVTCTEIEAAELLLDRSPFQLVVSDLRVSELGGFEGLRIVRHVATNFPDTEVIVFSGVLDEEVRRLAEKSGAARVLEKPSDLGRLREYALQRDGGKPAPTGLPGVGRVVNVEPLEEVLTGGRIRALLQPILALKQPRRPFEAFGVECLARGPEGSVLEDPELLFGYAARKQKLFETDMLCAEEAFRAALCLPADALLFVNVHPRSMSHPRFAERLRRMVRARGYSVERVVLEITEQQTIVNPLAFSATVDELRELGFRFALDDYGEGFANLQLVLDLRPEFLKISGYFCRGLDRDPRKQAIVAATVDLTERLQIATIMERIETAEELETVRDLGVDYGQGYYFARPASAGEIASSFRFRALEPKPRKSFARETDEDYYRSLFEDSQDAIFVSRPDGSVKDANPAAVRMFGFSSKEEMLAVDARDLYHRPEDREELLLLLTAEGSVRDFELTLKNRQGKTITALETSTAVRDEAGRVVAFRGIIRDVTEQRKLENQLRQSQKMEALGRLAAGVAHDFNNLLTVITGSAELGLQKISPGEPIAFDLEQIQKTGLRATSLTRQLLAFTRQQVLRPRVIDLNRVVSEFQQLLGRTIGDDVELVTALDPELGRVKADPGQIEQVLMNLAVNSRDAMPHGGRIVVETARKELDDTYASSHVAVEPGSYSMLAVSDDGTGMDRETRRRVFEPFFTTKEKGKGTGLGLSTVYGIVKQSGGSIWLYSEPGEGTIVKIYLPCVDEEEELPATVREPRPVGECTETILVVDDDEGIRSFAAKVLEAKGFRVLAARSGQDALEVFEEHAGKIALVVTDVVMSGMEGIRLAERLSGARPSVKTILMSGYTEHAALRSESASDVPFIAKPFGGEELVAKVREVLDGAS